MRPTSKPSPWREASWPGVKAAGSLDARPDSMGLLALRSGAALASCTEGRRALRPIPTSPSSAADPALGLTTTPAPEASTGATAFATPPPATTGATDDEWTAAGAAGSGNGCAGSGAPASALVKSAGALLGGVTPSEVLLAESDCEVPSFDAPAAGLRPRSDRRAVAARGLRAATLSRPSAEPTATPGLPERAAAEAMPEDGPDPVRRCDLGGA